MIYSPKRVALRKVVELFETGIVLRRQRQSQNKISRTVRGRKLRGRPAETKQEHL